MGVMVDGHNMQHHKRQLGEALADFAIQHGPEEALKLASRFLLGLVHTSNNVSIEFSDEGVGRVIIQAESIKPADKN